MSARAAVASVTRHGEGRSLCDQDLVAVEAPVTLQVVQAGRDEVWSLGVLMRTPGDDDDLATGLLLSEGLIRSAREVHEVTSLDTSGDDRDEGARLSVVVSSAVDLADAFRGRAQLRTSACGLCGRLALLGLAPRGSEPGIDATWPAAFIASLPDRLLDRQTVFSQTGGLHAAGLFDQTGRLVVSREDVGRHNAVDKVVGAASRTGRAPQPGDLLVVSGRAAYEIVQKAVSAGASAVVAVGAPSSLAVDAARAAALTLVGFARDGRFNVYAGHGRVR